MTLTTTQIGILRDVRDNKIDLNESGLWLIGEMVELVLHEPQLIDGVGPSVILTDAGRAALATSEALP